MAYETKVILTLLAERTANAETVKEVYEVIRIAATVEGMQLPPMEELRNKNKSGEG
ncbi:MAG: hypothetical protein FWE74_04960 [Oscillospiraceae bacterium]|nr:hypothetical protein [Oscillospiraceae bacterium]